MASNCVDYEFVGKLRDGEMCFICMKVLNEPQMVNCCEKKICKSCLTKWMTRNKSCPHCRSTDFSYMLLQGLSRRLSKLKVYCANKKCGCKFTLMVSEYKHHLSTDNVQGCLFTKLPCPNKCNVQDIFRGDLDNHCKEKCPRRIVKCRYCKIQGEYRVISGEHINTCPLYPITCPQACGDQIVRKDLTAHQDICPLEPVACSFSDVGCNVKVPRRDLDKHIQSSMLQHMKDMATSYSTTKTQLMELKQEHEALKKKHEEDYEVLKKDNKSLKKKHEVLKEDYEDKIRAVGFGLKNLSTDASVSTAASQLYTLLIDTSTLEMGNTLSLSLSDSNAEFGHHYIILSKYKFKLEWRRWPQRTQKVHRNNYYQIKLYLVTNEEFPPLTNSWGCEFRIATPPKHKSCYICCGKCMYFYPPKDMDANLLLYKETWEIWEMATDPKIEITFNNHDSRTPLPRTPLQPQEWAPLLHTISSRECTPCSCECHRKPKHITDVLKLATS